ncbi:hypothetical protein ABEB36_015646 [Hypothenemus hampei]|uniref:Nucleic-acid-binding protein n=1 Tax=Hypothenemus hampei TaxID=57062 RepID=A0ABD1E1P7_HYPHA
MATVPSTLVIQTLDKNEFPINMAYVVRKQLFRYGVKDISVKKGSVLISLSYTPKYSTLLKKMGNLPVKYTRIQVHSEEELGLLEKTVQKYNFNIINDDEIIEKRALEIEKPKQKSDIKILQDITLPSSSSVSTPKTLPMEPNPMKRRKKTLASSTLVDLDDILFQDSQIFF